MSRIADANSSDTIRILTSDRDLGDGHGYPSITPFKWYWNKRHEVMYVPARKLSIARALKTIDEWNPELVYLNSLYSTFSLTVMTLKKLGLFENAILVVAPRGELSPGALAIKSWKKKSFKPIIKWLYKSQVCWHLSSAKEMGHLFQWWGPEKLQNHTYIVEPPPSSPPIDHIVNPSHAPISFRIGFVSRISRKKGLDKAIAALRNVKEMAQFDIYGPIEDTDYWKECLKGIDGLSENIKVTYRGILQPEQTSIAYQRFDLFLFPTAGENFGHVIAEALSVGCPVLTTSHTPWTRTIKDGGGVIADDLASISEGISAFSKLDTPQRQAVRAKTLESYRKWYLTQVGPEGFFDRAYSRMSENN